MKRTVKATRELLHSPATAPRKWSRARCYATFGWTKAAVQRQLVTVNFCGKDVAVHRKIAASLNRVEKRIRAREHLKKWEHWKPERVESFNWRFTRGGTSRSMHSWAIALDIDPGTNPYYAHYTAKNTMDIPPYVLQAFADEGWTLGAEWNTPNDTMHVSYVNG